MFLSPLSSLSLLKKKMQICLLVRIKKVKNNKNEDSCGLLPETVTQKI